MQSSALRPVDGAREDVSGWLGAIAMNLIANRSFDVAVRDIVIAVGAFSLARRLYRAARAETRRQPAPEQRPSPDTERTVGLYA